MTDFDDTVPVTSVVISEIAIFVALVGLSIAGAIAGFRFWDWAPGAWTQLIALIK